MLYSFIEMQRAALKPFRAINNINNFWLKSSLNPFAHTDAMKKMAAASDLFEALTRRYGRPEWKIENIVSGGIECTITPTSTWESPWCKLMHFVKTPVDDAKKLKPMPRILIVAPLSGHYATLLKGTVEAFLQDHEVYITDWSDAKEVPVLYGRFDMDDFIDHVSDMVRFLGPNTHVMAVCQPGPAVLAMVAMMNEDNDPCTPPTMIFVGSPIDARKSPTIANKLAEERPFTWFKSNMIYTVPAPNAGAFRRVYPGFVQLASFMSLNKDRHMDAHKQYFDHLVEGDDDSAAKHREFYDEYLSVLDLTEEFYLQTIERVFQEYQLPLGKFYHRGRLIKPDAITKTALLTIEGELDDISGIGQTQAAHDLCVNIPEDMKQDHVQEGAGHYGVFNGRRFSQYIYPIEREFIAKHNG